MSANPFVREQRYYVVKRKHLTPEQEAELQALLAKFEAEGMPPTRQSVVVECNRPYYEAVWRLIREEAEGTILWGSRRA